MGALKFRHVAYSVWPVYSVPYTVLEGHTVGGTHLLATAALRLSMML